MMLITSEFVLAGFTAQKVNVRLVIKPSLKPLMRGYFDIARTAVRAIKESLRALRFHGVAIDLLRS